jgi:transposase
MERTQNWRNLFFTAYKESGFIQSTIERIYSIEMKLRTFFDFGDIIPTNLQLQNIEKDESGLRYYWISESHEAQCPRYNTLSTHPCAGDYVEKAVQDIPRDNLPVFHIIQLKRFECENQSCETDRFVERFYELTEENARKTLRFKRYCMKRALGGGCLQVERDIRDEGGIVSNDSIGRYLKAAAAGKIEENIVKNNVKVLAVDDINLRKGDKSSGCTVFVDGETHKVLIVVKGTTKEATKRVIEKFEL